MDTDIPEVQIQLNLEVPRGDLQRALQRSIYLVSGALNASSNIEATELKLPETGIEMNFDPSIKWTSDEVRSQLKEWILQNGFRDSVESLSGFLESIHTVCSVWSMVQKQSTGQVLKGSDLQILTEADPKKFHRLGFPDKLDHLRDSHSIAVEDTMLKHVLSINVARNCLVHRNGIVGDKDSENGRLIVSWRRMKFLVVDEDGERELVLGVANRKGGTVILRSIDEEKIFNLGESISFSSQEFQHIAWSLFQFGNALTASLVLWGQNNKFLPPPHA